MDGIGWTTLAAIVAAVVTLGGVLVRLIDRINTADKKAETAEALKAAAEKAITISPTQITVEINTTRPASTDEILGALLDVVVQIIGQPIQHPEHLRLAAPATEGPHKGPPVPQDTS